MLCNSTIKVVSWWSEHYSQEESFICVLWKICSENFCQLDNIGVLFKKVLLLQPTTLSQRGSSGAQPEIFQGRGGFMKLGHFDKHFIKKSRKKVPHGKYLKFFPLDTLKTTFWMANLTEGWTQLGHFFPKIRALFLIFKKWQGRSPPLPS